MLILIFTEKNDQSIKHNECVFATLQLATNQSFWRKSKKSVNHNFLYSSAIEYCNKYNIILTLFNTFLQFNKVLIELFTLKFLFKLNKNNL